MALPVDDTQQTADTPFTWGAGGARMTPEQIAARRKVADALAAQAGDYSPIKSWTQGAARLAQGVSAGLDARAADKAEQANADANKQMIAALIAGGSGGSAAPAAAADAGGSGTVSVTAPTPTANTTGKIYSNDEPSPLDPPSGADRDALIRTVYGEAGNEPALGQQAVAAVIRNRAVDGGYGGDTPSAVVHAPNQFEPWNGGVAKARMLALSPDDPKYQAISKVVDAAYGAGGKAPEDPTEGMTHFYSPGGQAALGRAAPAWAGGESVTIGGHVFNSPDDAAGGKPVQVASNDPAAIPANATAAQGYAVPGQAPAAAAPAPGVAKVAGAMSGVNPAVLAAVTSPYADETTKKIAGIMLQQQMTPKDVHSQETDSKGNIWDVNKQTGQRTVALKADAPDKGPASVQEYEYYKKNADPSQPVMPYSTWSTAKARAGATNVTTTVGGENKGLDEAAKIDAEAVRKGQNEQMPALEDADHNFQLMQAAIERNGGQLPTGGELGKLGLDWNRTKDYIAQNWGVDLGSNPNTTTSLETFNKGGIKAAGDMAKAIGGSRVLKVEFDMAQKANPGLETSDGGNKYLLDVNRNGIAVKHDYLQAQEDYWRNNNHSLDGFQKSWNAEIKANPRPLSNFSVAPPIDNGDGSKMVKLPSTAQGGYSWFQKGPNGNSVVTDPDAVSKLEGATNALPKAPVAPVEKIIGGKTYIKQDGNWFEKH